ncbi:MAG: hypothetical protein GYA60_06355 [Candidatus Methanofastidiosa archaeon]|jgi:hypothetical protein|nr:hypothetical protein [Candidatus Methanofastidiosa archaeon]
MGPLENIVRTIEELILTIENNGNYKEKQIEFTNAIENAWEVYSKGKIDTKVNALPRVMYIYATQELPKEIDNGNLKKVLTDLKQFKNTMKYVVEPSYR